MNIQEIKDLKRDAELQIEKILMEFNKKTGLEISDISSTTYTRSFKGNKFVLSIKVETTVTIP